ncbi:MAG: AcrR family transcriptional regulator [Saprospiraceae bacterium]|jgi:AcrR family transcriptional regulator
MQQHKVKPRKEEILDCAARLFREKGYKATSMRDIAKAVGIQGASLYNHIKSKQELLAALLLFIAHLFTKEMNKINKSPLPPVEKIERLIGLHVRYTAEHTDAISIITSEWVHLEEPVLSEYLGLRADYEKKFEKIIADCIKEGTFEKVNTRIALFSILSTLRWLYSWYSNQKNIDPVELEQQMVHCLLTGLIKR